MLLPGNGMTGVISVRPPDIQDRRRGYLPAMSDVLRFANINDFVRRMVGDALKALGDNHQIEASRDAFSIANHQVSEAAINFLIHLVHFLVAWTKARAASGSCLTKQSNDCFNIWTAIWAIARMLSECLKISVKRCWRFGRGHGTSMRQAIGHDL
jgi:hypothetical protein